MGGGGSALRVCAEHRGGINWLSLSPDGQRLLTGSEDGTARLWSTADGQCCALLRGRRARPPSSGSVLPILSPAQTSALPPTDPPQSPAPPIAGPQPGQLRTAGGYLAGGRGGEGRRGAGCSGVSGRGAPSAGLSLVNPEREMFPLQQLTQRNSPPPQVSSAVSGLSLARAPLAGHLPPAVRAARGLQVPWLRALSSSPGRRYPAQAGNRGAS